MLAADFAPHNLLPGLDGIKMVHQGTLAAFPDLHVTTEDVIAEGDRVVERWSQTQTHSGAPFMNIPPSGKKARITGISIYRVKDGKIADHWAEMDFLGVLQQLGAMPAPGQEGL